MFLKLLNLVGETPQTDPFCRGREKTPQHCPLILFHSTLPFDTEKTTPPALCYCRSNPRLLTVLGRISGKGPSTRFTTLAAGGLTSWGGCNLDRPEPQSLAWYSRAPIFAGQKKIPVSCRFRGDILASLRELSPSPIKREIRGPKKNFH